MKDTSKVSSIRVNSVNKSDCMFFFIDTSLILCGKGNSHDGISESDFQMYFFLFYDHFRIAFNGKT